MLKKVRKHVHKRVLFQLVIFCVISLVLFSIVVFDIMTQELNPFLIMLGVIIGVLLGFAFARSFKMSWHKDSQKVIIGLDKLGILLIVLYGLFRYFEQQFLGQFIQGITLTAFTYALLGGIMVGRLISVSRGINKILKEQKLI